MFVKICGGEKILYISTCILHTFYQHGFVVCTDGLVCTDTNCKTYDIFAYTQPYTHKSM